MIDLDLQGKSLLESVLFENSILLYKTVFDESSYRLVLCNLKVKEEKLEIFTRTSKPYCIVQKKYLAVEGFIGKMNWQK